MNDMYSNYLKNDPFIRTFMMPAVAPKDMNRADNTFVTANEGFLRGNMEKGTYMPYKNMNFIKPVINDERKMALYKIQEAAFAAHDANLYLDTHPKDTNMIRLYNMYLNEEKKLNDEYERKYGPIDLSDEQGLNLTPWAWINEPWPWNK